MCAGSRSAGANLHGGAARSIINVFDLAPRLGAPDLAAKKGAKGAHFARVSPVHTRWRCCGACSPHLRACAEHCALCTVQWRLPLQIAVHWPMLMIALA